MTTFHISLITPERALFSGEAEMVIVPGAEGEFGALRGHAPFISALKAGVVRVEGPGGDEILRAAVAGGVAEVTPQRVLILCENAQLLEAGTDAEAALAKLTAPVQ